MVRNKRKDLTKKSDKSVLLLGEARQSGQQVINMVKVFSGIRPSGKLHLGNYLGAIKNWIELQNEADQAILAVVDYHGITTPYNPKTYQQQIIDVVLDYLAAGVDPDKALLIRQSKVPQHTELAWLFNTITPVSWLDRLPTYKE